MVKGSRLARQARVQMPKRRLSVGEKFLLAYLKISDKIVDRMFKGKISEQEKQELRVLMKESPDSASLVSSYLTRKKV